MTDPVLNGGGAVNDFGCYGADPATWFVVAKRWPVVRILPRLPARLDVNQAAEILGFLPHEIRVLLKVGLLKPLGKPAANGHKYFSSLEISALSENRSWLDKATCAMASTGRTEISSQVSP